MKDGNTPLNAFEI